LLAVQSFHNEVRPDCFDNTNYNFMFRLMPYYFGAGCCFVTGTNVMIRARAAFLACRFDENPHAGDTQNLPAVRDGTPCHHPPTTHGFLVVVVDVHVHMSVPVSFQAEAILSASITQV
jgi:hypothetical protein